MDQTSDNFFDYLCRTCMLPVDGVTQYSATSQSKQQWQSLFEEIAECDSINIAELISTTIPQITVQLSDKLPKKICHECLKKLQNSYLFQKMCLQSNQQMHEMIAKRDEQLKTTMSKPLVGNALPQEAILKEEFIDCRDEDDIQGDTGYVNEIPETSQLTAIDPLQGFNEPAVGDCVKSEPCSDNEPINDQSSGEKTEKTILEETIEKESMSLSTFENRDCLKMHLSHHKKRAAKQHYRKDVTVSTEKEPVNLCTDSHTCCLCKKSFKKYIYLQMHLKRNKTCAQQQTEHPRDEQNEQPEKSKNKLGDCRFKCDTCNRSFLKQESLCLHRLRRHTEANNEYRYTCEVCEKTFNSGITLAKHYKYKHSENPQQKPHKKKNVKTDSKNKDHPFQCDSCNRTFLKPESLRYHRLRRHVKANNDSRYTCEVCKKTFNSGITLALHDKCEHSEANAKKFACNFCQKNCKNAYRLTAHLRTHTGERPYLCPECGKSFTTTTHLQLHRLRHSEVKSLECPYCPKMFRCSSDLSSHKLIHRETKPYVCDICGYKTVESHQLTKHKKHHSGEKPHKCEYCEMRFVRADQQRRHMRTHTGEKPYKCKYCERAFAQGNDLIKHLRSHLGDNVYRCELCPLGFRLARDLRAHFTTHKNDDEETRQRNMKALREENAKLELKLSANENPKTVENETET